MDPQRSLTGANRGEAWLFSGTLVYADPPTGKLAPEQSYAKAFKLSEDGTYWDFTLREGVKFHNGDELTAEDVKFSLERTIRPDLKFVYRTTLVARMDRVEIVSKYVVRVYTKNPDPLLADFLTLAGWIVPKRYIETVGDEGFNSKPIGAGPYKMVKWEVMGDSNLQAYADYWAGFHAGAPETIVVKTVPEETTRIAMLKAGEADIIEGLSAAMVKDIEATKGLRVVGRGGLVAYFLKFDTMTEGQPFKDKRVRQAIMYAIDKGAIIEGLFKGRALKLTDNVMPVGPYGSGPTGGPTYDYNPAKAKELLAAAGYTKGFITNFYGPSGYANQMLAIAGYLAEVGIETKVQPMETGAYYTKVTKKELRELHLGAAGMTVWDGRTYLGWYIHSTGLYGLVANPEFDKLADEAYKISDIDKMSEYLRTVVFRKVQEEALVGPMWDIFANFGISSRVEWTPSVRRPYALHHIETAVLKQ